MLEKYKANYHVKLAVLPTMRLIAARPHLYSPGIAADMKQRVFDWLDSTNVDYVTIDGIINGGLLYNEMDAETCAEYFRSQKVDALFIPFCNFGAEGALSRVAKLLEIPVLIWAPRDTLPPENFGIRDRDSQCGIFAASRVLNTFGVKFTYIQSCTLESETFRRGFRTFMGAAAVRKGLNGLRILQIGARPTGFLSVRCNEAQLLERFGIEVVTLTVQDIYERWSGVLTAQRELISETMTQIREKVDKCSISEETLEKVAALKLAIGQAADELGCRAGCVNCSDPLRNITGIMPCFVLGDLTGDGLPMICESDIHGAISSVMALAASQSAGCDYPTFLMDLTNRHELDDNMELLWHCGVFPLALKKEGTVSELTHHYGAPKEGTCRVSIRNGPINLLRFDGAHDKYSVLMARGKIVDGPETNCTYGWGEFENWPALEEKLIYGPYIHHIVGVYADIAPMIYEALRYIDGVEPDFFSPTVEEIQRAMRK